LDSLSEPKFSALPFTEVWAEKECNAAWSSEVREPLSVEVLLARIAQGDQQALGRLFDRYARIVRAIAGRILRDESEAEDLVQDLFLFIQRKCSVFDSSKSSAGSWIVHMTYQRAIERRRHLVSQYFYRREDVQTSLRRAVGIATTENDYSPEAVFGRNGLEKVLSSLSEDQRETLRLFFFEGYTFSAVYHYSFTDLASIVGVPLNELGRLQRSIEIPRTHLLRNQAAGTEKVSVPVRFKPEFHLEKTNLLARVVEKWDEIPLALLQRLDLEKSSYGYIGLEDYTMHPLIRPGSLVQIDPSQRKPSTERWNTEYDRPVYFIELRDGYICSWCEVGRGQLIVVPHAHSHQGIRCYDYPTQAEIVGRVTGVAMRIVEQRGPEIGRPGGSVS
jgi:RNA polymerase sigma factor (sigma-70 family)